MNASIASFARGVDDGIGPWEFHCECGEADCTEWVEIALAAYLALRDAGDPVLASGHAASRAAQARTKARSLRGDAAALRAQASEQGTRARRAEEAGAQARAEASDGGR